MGGGGGGNKNNLISRFVLFPTLKKKLFGKY